MFPVIYGSACIYLFGQCLSSPVQMTKLRDLLYLEKSPSCDKATFVAGKYLGHIADVFFRTGLSSAALSMTFSPIPSSFMDFLNQMSFPLEMLGLGVFFKLGNMAFEHRFAALIRDRDELEKRAIYRRI